MKNGRETGRIDSVTSLWPIDAYHHRFVQNGRCVDVYIELAGPDVLVDLRSIRYWHSNEFASWHYVENFTTERTPVTEAEAREIANIVVSTIKRRHGKRNIVVIGDGV